MVRTPGQIKRVMASRLSSYLRTYRRRSGLTQDEVAFLLGCRSGAKVSRLERFARLPNLEAALACKAIFGVPAHEMFPGVYAVVEEEVIERARILASRLAHEAASDRRSRRKFEALEALVAGTAPADDA